jgi:hypothetical protein
MRSAGLYTRALSRALDKKRVPSSGHLLGKLAASAAFALAATALLGTAAAQDAPTVQSLREKARAAIASGDTAGACQLFEQAHQAALTSKGDVTADAVLFEVAECH